MTGAVSDAPSALAPDALRAADCAARAIAQREFVRPLLLQAGAGTGKTSVLVTRVLAWCLGPGWARAEAACATGGEAADADAVAARVLERVVAVTFTEAAAAEMEERIAQGLRALAAESDAALPAGLDSEALPADPALRRVRARALLTAFDRLRVSTIHAFCRRLLAEHPREAGVHPRFTVDADGLARAAAAREVVEEWAFDPARAADDALLELVEAGIAAPELEAMLDALLASAVDPARFAEDPLAPPRVADLVARLRAAAEAFLAAEGGALRGAPRRTNGGKVADAAEETRAACVASPADAAGLAALLSALQEFWPDSLRRRLAQFAGGTFTAEGERDALGSRAGALCRAAAELDPLLRDALRLAPARLALVHRTVAPLYERAAARMGRDGAVSFDALLRRASALLERHPEVAARQRARIDQLLVDEFQDTDATQCALVARLALAPEGGPRPGLFVVGDPKQSIYGWRSADLAAYEEFRERLCEAGGAVHELCVNYRSVPAVLAEVERAIAPVMRAVPRAQPPFERLLPDRDGTGAVEYWIASDWGDQSEGAGRTAQRDATEREAERLAADLLREAREARESGRTWRWSEVGVLLRATSDVEFYLARLREAGIPYTVARDRQYARRREVVEARALARAVLDPGDQIALVAALRAAWAGVPDAAWRPLWRRGFPDAIRGFLEGRADARERLTDVLRGAAAEVAGRAAALPGFAALAGWDAALLHAAEVLAALRRSFAREPAERFVERLRTLPLLEAGEAARFLGPWRLANLERFFRELARLLEDGRGDVAAVLRALRRDDAADSRPDEGRPARPVEDAVQVMTIHGAKGLQFEQVYLLQVHKGEAGEQREPFRAGEGALAGEWCLAGLATPGFDRVRAARRRVEEHERVRTLYVAMTRARRRLVVSGHWKHDAARGAHGRLLAESRGAALREAVARGVAAGAGWDGECDHDGVHWVFLDRAPALRETALEVGGDRALDEARVRADGERLAAQGAAASARAARPLTAAVTAGAAAVVAAAREAEGERGEGEERVHRRPPPAAEGAAAAAVGTAIHALLERLDAAAEDADAGWRRERAVVHAALERSLPPALLAPARDRADALLDRLRSGALWQRLRTLAPHVVARELPVLIEPEPGAGPVGAGVGAIDLVHRDPEGGGLVVVDFKTDRIDAPRVLEERAAHHRAQGLAYRRAVARALALDAPPRVELWFLDADQAVRID